MITANPLPEIAATVVDTLAQDLGARWNIELRRIECLSRHPPAPSPNRRLNLHDTDPKDLALGMPIEQGFPLRPGRRVIGIALNVESGQYAARLYPGNGEQQRVWHLLS